MKQYRMYVAEFIGAGTLSLAVLLSVSTELGTLATPILAALVLGLFVYTIGGVSGCHINPAVTLGVYARGKIKLAQTVGYIVAQCLGAFAAILIVSNTVMDLSGYTMTTPESMSVFIAEFIGMALFTFGIASVAFGKVSQVASGVVIGGSLLLGITVASLLGSAGVLNPAVALALGTVSYSYLGAMILGSIAGMHLHGWLCE